ncbi:MAG TPA: response regulator [Myxococcales bacterium]|nr:response regulator [Myxococcales bacterium]
MVEDSERDAALVLRQLRRMNRGIEAHRVEDAGAMKEAIAASSWDIVLSDWTLPHFSGLDALAVLKALAVDIPFIIVSGTVGEETAVTAIQAGAADYVLKGALVRLLPAVERALQEREARRARRRLEEQLRQAQKLEAIGSLAGGVAHDFNNLLSIILTYSDLLMRALPSDSPMREDLSEIKKAGERARDLTRQLLMFSRQQVIEPRVLCLNDPLQGIRTMLDRLIGEDIELSIVRSPDLWDVEADPGQIEQVLMNLVVNARDAMPDGGKLTIETANVVLDEDYQAQHPGAGTGPHVMLAVIDTGTGMDAVTRSRIFEPFFTTKGPGKGTGLGLSTVFGIVKQNRGNVWVYSEPGLGTAFKIYLPRTEAAREEKAPVPVAPRVSGNETILVVEDEASLRAAALRVLRELGYRVLEAALPSEAIALCERSTDHIHLLLTDVVMPEMNGRQLADRLRQGRPSLKVLYTSGYTENTIVHHGVPEAGIHFLPKPISPDLLAAKVRSVLDS